MLLLAVIIVSYCFVGFVVLAVVGIAIWECLLTGESKYCAMQTSFHTFSVDKKMHSIQFAK